jgi:hypothetical protein
MNDHQRPVANDRRRQQFFQPANSRLCAATLLALVSLQAHHVCGQVLPARKPVPTFIEPLGLQRAKVAVDPLVRARQERDDARVQQYVQMLQPVLWTELEFVRQICVLAPHQRPKIKAAAEASMEDAARYFTVHQARTQAMQSQAIQKIRARLTEALREALEPQQFDDFLEEAEQRIAHRKQTAILSAISQLDGVLCLTPQQREKLLASLEANWQDDWEQWLVVQRFGAGYFPQVPDQHIAAHLNADQQAVWRTLQKVSLNVWTSASGPARRDDGWWDGNGGDAVTTKPASNLEE